jgi:hypothetical protein
VGLVVRCLSSAVSHDTNFPRVTTASCFCSRQLSQRSTFHLCLHLLYAETGENGLCLLLLLTVIIIIIITSQQFLAGFQRVGVTDQALMFRYSVKDFRTTRRVLLSLS